MGDFFKVGERYENRFGEYEVLEVRTPELQIRYVANNRLQTVEEALQERIVRNLRRERELQANPPESKRRYSRSSAPRLRRPKFDGFVEADFEGKAKEGSGWRTKAGLAGWLAQSLSTKGEVELKSWAPQRRPTAYVSTPDQASAERLADSAQLFIELSSSEATYGLTVQRPADNPEGASAWDRLLQALSDDETLAQRLGELLQRGSAVLTWYADKDGSANGEVVREQGDALVSERSGSTEPDTIDALVQRLQDAPQDDGLTLTISSSIDAQEAMRSGAAMADAIYELLSELAVLFYTAAG